MLWSLLPALMSHGACPGCVFPAWGDPATHWAGPTLPLAHGAGPAFPVTSQSISAWDWIFLGRAVGGPPNTRDSPVAWFLP